MIPDQPRWQDDLEWQAELEQWASPRRPSIIGELAVAAERRRLHHQRDAMIEAAARAMYWEWMRERVRPEVLDSRPTWERAAQGTRDHYLAQAAVPVDAVLVVGGVVPVSPEEDQ